MLIRKSNFSNPGNLKETVNDLRFMISGTVISTANLSNQLNAYS